MEKKSKDKVGSLKKTYTNLTNFGKVDLEKIEKTSMKNFSMIFEVQCEQLYANKVDKVDKMDKSLEKYIFKN